MKCKNTGMRIGNGYDVHKLTTGRDLILGGALIPHETGLFGHSDADVLIHAIMDSIIGALALGDIGVHFPDNDVNFKDISSIKLLKKVTQLMQDNGYEIQNIDTVIAAQRPKLKDYIQQMRQNIAEALQTDIGNVSIKATTEEQLGFTGREEGIKAYSVCILKN